MPRLLSPLHLAIFGSTMVIYTLPKLVPAPYGKPRPSSPMKKWHYLFLALGTLIMLPGLLSLPLNVAIVAVASGIVALAYFLPAIPFVNRKRLRDYGITKITMLTAVWTIATAVLPLMYWKVQVIDYPFEILLRYVFVFALCILFDIRDMQVDISNNIATLPNKIGIAYAFTLVHVSLVLFFMLSAMQYLVHPTAGRLTAAALTATVTAGVAMFVKRNPGHKGFVMMTDGMMLLYAVLIALPWV